MDRQEQKTETEAIEKEIQAIMEGGKKEETPGKKRRRPGKKAGKVLLLIFLGGGLLFAGSRFLFGGGGGLPQVELGSLARGSITESLTVTGPVEGTDSVDVTSRLHARITELKVKEGDRVEKGQLIGTAAEGLSVPVHASVSGTVQKTEQGAIILAADR